MNNKGADQTVRVLRLVCVFVVLTQHSQVFFCRGAYCYDIPQLVSDYTPSFSLHLEPVFFDHDPQAVWRSGLVYRALEAALAVSHWPVSIMTAWEYLTLCILMNCFIWFDTMILWWFVCFCLIWFFTSHQQSFGYVGTGLPRLNQN